MQIRLGYVAISKTLDKITSSSTITLTNFKKNPDDEEVINLIQYQIFMNNKLNFLNKYIETVRDRRQLLITFNSCMKIESTF